LQEDFCVVLRLHMQVLQPGTERKTFINVCQKNQSQEYMKHSIYSRDVSTLFLCHFQSYSNKNSI